MRECGYHFWHYVYMPLVSNTDYSSDIIFSISIFVAFFGTRIDVVALRRVLYYGDPLTHCDASMCPTSGEVALPCSCWFWFGLVVLLEIQAVEVLGSKEYRQISFQFSCSRIEPWVTRLIFLLIPGFRHLELAIQNCRENIQNES